jgi:membrane protein
MKKDFIMKAWNRIENSFFSNSYDMNTRAKGRLTRLGMTVLRFLSLIVSILTEEQLILRATSLVYTTLLSFVPLLAVSFSVLKAFGVQARIQIFLYYFLEPFGEKGVDLAMKIISFVEQVNVSILGSLGLSMLIYTVLSQIQKVESALNYIWHVRSTRSLSRRFSSYMSVLLIGPVLIFSAMGLTASLMSTSFIRGLTGIREIGVLLLLIEKVIPYLIISGAFAFIYVFLPNTKVHLRSALVGGIFAGVVWKATGMIFAAFVVSSAQYSAIYSGFALFILFFIWLYWTWLILLVGGKVSFYHQHPKFINITGKDVLPSDTQKERLALSIMFLLGESFYQNKEPWTSDSLGKRLRYPAEAVYEVLNLLEQKGMIISSSGDPSAHVPARDLETLSVKEVLDVVRLPDGDQAGINERSSSIPEVDAALQRMDDAISHSLAQETIKGLILSKK